MRHPLTIRLFAWLGCVAAAGVLSYLGMMLWLSAAESGPVGRRIVAILMCWPALVYFSLGGPEIPRIFTQWMTINTVTWSAIFVAGSEWLSRVGKKTENKALHGTAESRADAASSAP